MLAKRSRGGMDSGPTIAIGEPTRKRVITSLILVVNLNRRRPQRFTQSQLFGRALPRRTTPSTSVLGPTLLQNIESRGEGGDDTEDGRLSALGHCLWTRRTNRDVRRHVEVRLRATKMRLHLGWGHRGVRPLYRPKGPGRGACLPSLPSCSMSGRPDGILLSLHAAALERPVGSVDWLTSWNREVALHIDRHPQPTSFLQHFDPEALKCKMASASADQCRRPPFIATLHLSTLSLLHAQRYMDVCPAMWRICIDHASQPYSRVMMLFCFISP